MNMQKELDIHKKIIDWYPDAIVIVHNGKVILSNRAAKSLIPEIENEGIENLLDSHYAVAFERIEEVLREKRSTKPKEYPILLKDQKTLWMELSTHYVEISDVPATITLAKQAAIANKHETQSTMVQRHLMMHQKWVFDGIYGKPLFNYVGDVGGTFYFTQKHSEHIFYGMTGEFENQTPLNSVVLGTVEGFFRESSLTENALDQVWAAFSKKLGCTPYIDNISFLLWSMDTKKKTMTILSKGISKIVVYDEAYALKTHRLESTSYHPNGSTKVDCIHLDLQKIKAILLPANNLDFWVPFRYGGDIHQLCKDINTRFNENRHRLDAGQTHLCSFVFDLDAYKVSREYIFLGLKEYQAKVDAILKDISGKFNRFTLRLIIMELLTNAYKHGNENDEELPIKLIVSESATVLMIEVHDMRIKKNIITFKRDINEAKLIEENGRGLFLVRAYAEDAYSDGTCIIAKLAPEEV